MFNASMFENSDHISEDGDAHVSEVILGQLTQHVGLNTMLSERNGIVTSIGRRDASIEKELEPNCCQPLTSL